MGRSFNYISYVGGCCAFLGVAEMCCCILLEPWAITFFLTIVNHG